MTDPIIITLLVLAYVIIIALVILACVLAYWLYFKEEI